MGVGIWWWIELVAQEDRREKAVGRVKGTLGFVAWTYRCMLIPLAEFWKQEEAGWKWKSF